MRDIHATHRCALSWALGALTVLLSLSGCATTGSVGAASQPRTTATTTLIPISPTPTPMTLHIHTFSMSGYQPSTVLPGADGLVLFPSVPPSFAGLPYYDFYRYSDQKVERLMTAPTEPDGSQGITEVTYAGDWVTYKTEDSNQGHWVLWVVNVSTGERRQVDSEARDPVELIGLTNNGTDLVWSTLSGSSAFAMRLLDYTYATGQTRVLGASSTEIFKPLAMNATTILMGETNVETNVDTTWLQRLDQASPTKIADGRGVNGWMSSRYAVWDDPHTNFSVLYDLTTGQLNPNFAPCLRPTIADPQPYLVCVNFNTESYLLVHMPDGAQTAFDQRMYTGEDAGEFYNGRIFFIGPDNSVEFFDLPAT